MHMKKGISKSLTLFFLGTFVLISLIGLISASPASGTWYGAIMDFLGFGETWAEAWVSIFIFVIISAALYDILGLTMFRSQPVKILIGIGIGAISGIIGGIRAIAGFVFGAAGGISAISIGLVIAIASVSFLLLHFGVSKLAVLMEKGKGDVEAERAANIAKASARAERARAEELTR